MVTRADLNNRNRRVLVVFVLLLFFIISSVVIYQLILNSKTYEIHGTVASVSEPITLQENGRVGQYITTRYFKIKGDSRNFECISQSVCNTLIVGRQIGVKARDNLLGFVPGLPQTVLDIFSSN